MIGGRIEGIEFTQLARLRLEHRTCPCRSRTARCCMPTTPIIWNMCASPRKPPAEAPTRNRPRRIAALAGRKGVLGIEKVMDHLAQELGLDPLAVRRANYYADNRQETSAGKAVDGREVPPDGGDLASRIAPQAIEGCVCSAKRGTDHALSSAR